MLSSESGVDFLSTRENSHTVGVGRGLPQPYLLKVQKRKLTITSICLSFEQKKRSLGRCRLSNSTKTHRSRTCNAQLAEKKPTNTVQSHTHKRTTREISDAAACMIEIFLF